MVEKEDKSGAEEGTKSLYLIAGHAILGKPIDIQTRCIHYHSPVDILAIRFKCCGQYYPCFSCHEETAGHPVQTWSISERNTKAILCGSCGWEMTINEYLSHPSECPRCQSPFNPKCVNHHPYYFEIK